MADVFDELRTLRHRLATIESRADRLAARDGTAGCQAVVLQTTTETTYPGSAGAFFACHVVSVGGTEAEGASPTTTAGTATVYALNVGTKKPPAGTKVVSAAADGRFVFQYDGEEA